MYIFLCGFMLIKCSGVLYHGSDDENHRDCIVMFMRMCVMTQVPYSSGALPVLIYQIPLPRYYRTTFQMNSRLI